MSDDETTDGALSAPDTDTQDALTDQGDADTESVRDAETPTEGGKLRGGVSARDAALRRWALHREREAQATDADADEAGDDVQYVRCTIATGQIIRRLAKDAKSGDVGAARELRAWMSELPRDRETQVSDLDRRTRAALLARLVEEIESDDIASAGEAAAEGATPATGGTPV